MVNSEMILVLIMALTLGSCADPQMGLRGPVGEPGPVGPLGPPGASPAPSTRLMVARKHHGPSLFLPDTLAFEGMVKIPSSLKIVTGCGSNDGGPDKAAQFEVVGVTRCLYNPRSTINKPCATANASQIADSLTYELVECLGGVEGGDWVESPSSLFLNLSKADSSQDLVSIMATLELQ